MSEQPCYSEQSAAADQQQTVSIEPGAARWIVPHVKQTSIGAVLPTHSRVADWKIVLLGLKNAQPDGVHAPGSSELCCNPQKDDASVALGSPYLSTSLPNT